MQLTQREYLDIFLNTLSTNTKSNIKVIEYSEDHKALHISSNKQLNTFIPRIGDAQTKSEDRTLPRVCVSPNLLGCILGYQRIVYDYDGFDYDKKFSSKKQNKAAFNQGYYIKKLDYEFALVPTAKLVYDQAKSDEEWLASYSKETSTYKSIDIGKFFITEIKYTSLNNKNSEITLTIYVTISESINLTDKILLEPGHHKIIIDRYNELLWGKESNLDKEKHITVTPISNAEFSKQKQFSSAMEEMPTYLQW